MATDCEQLFGINSPFNEEALKKRYRELAKQHHPDKFQDPDKKIQAHEKITQVNLCYDQLKQSAGGQGSQQKQPMAGEGWTTFEQYIAHIKHESDKTIVWDQHLDGEPGNHQPPLKPLSDELKQHVPFELYTHQAEALDQDRGGENLVIVTPTASGKSMGYMLPLFEQVLADPDATAIFIFPMKALANDQFGNFERLTNGKVSQAVFDGDTDKDTKAAIKNNPPNVLYTNPTLLFLGGMWHG